MTGHTSNQSTRDTSRPRTTLRVLCAEDEEPIAQLLVAVLVRAGFEATWVADGQTALNRITADVNYFDLLITDHQMPRLDGLTLVEKLRNTTFRGRIVVHSSHLDETDTTRYRRLAVDRILAKPVSLPDLLEAIGEVKSGLP